MWLLDGLWQRLGVAEALRGVLGARRFTTDVERVLFALVCNRAVDPMSKLSGAEWASHDAAIPRLAGMDDDQAYRAIDLLVEADAQARVQEAVFFAAAHGCAGWATCSSPGSWTPSTALPSSRSEAARSA